MNDSKSRLRNNERRAGGVLPRPFLSVRSKLSRPLASKLWDPQFLGVHKLRCPPLAGEDGTNSY